MIPAREGQTPTAAALLRACYDKTSRRRQLGNQRAIIMSPQGDPLALAWRYQQAGNRWQAEQLCRQILATQPTHAEALHRVTRLSRAVRPPG